MKLNSKILILFLTGILIFGFSSPVFAQSDLGEENIKYELNNYEREIADLIRQLRVKVDESKNSGVDPKIVAQINSLNRKLAGVKAKLADTRKALSDRKRVLAQAKKVFAGEKLKNVIPQDELNRARLYLENGDFSIVEGLFSQVMEKRKNRDEPLAEMAFALGKLAQDRVDYDSAWEYYNQAIQLSPSNGRYFNQAGFLAHSLADYPTAIEYFEKALQTYIKTYGPEHAYVAKSLSNLAEAWRKSGDINKAIGYFEKASSTYLKLLGADHPDVATNWNNLGLAWDHKGNYGKAVKYFEKALASNMKSLGVDHPNLATNWNNLGLAWGHQKEHDIAIFYYEKAIQSNINAYGTEHPGLATNWSNLAGEWEKKGENDKALGYFEKALAAYEKAGLPHRVQFVRGKIAKLRKLDELAPN